MDIACGKGFLLNMCVNTTSYNILCTCRRGWQWHCREWKKTRMDHPTATKLVLCCGSIHVSTSAVCCQVSSLISVAAEPLSDWLDAHLGSEIRDKSIFASLSRQFEEDFHSDMETLNVQVFHVLYERHCWFTYMCTCTSRCCLQMCWHEWVSMYQK